MLAALASSASPASAEMLNYTSTSNTGTIVLKEGDAAYQRTITNPTVGVDATIDDTTGDYSANTTFEPSYTDVFTGPFNLQIYVRADITQAMPLIGNIDQTTGALTGVLNAKFAITVYNTNTEPGVKHPDKDQKLADGATCFVNIALDFTGTYDQATGALAIADPKFNIPMFPGDTRSTGGTAGCAAATDAINQQVAGPNNSASARLRRTNNSYHHDNDVNDDEHHYQHDDVDDHHHHDVADQLHDLDNSPDEFDNYCRLPRRDLRQLDRTDGLLTVHDQQRHSDVPVQRRHLQLRHDQPGRVLGARWNRLNGRQWDDFVGLLEQRQQHDIEFGGDARRRNAQLHRLSHVLTKPGPGRPSESRSRAQGWGSGSACQVIQTDLKFDQAILASRMR